MWRAVRQRTKPARDWYRCHCERSEPCLKKRGHRFSCPLNKQRDISAPSLRCAVIGSDFCQPLRNNSSHQHTAWCSPVIKRGWITATFSFCVSVFLHCHCAPCRAETQFCLTLGEKCYTIFSLMPFLYLHLPCVFFLIERCWESLGHCRTLFPSC